MWILIYTLDECMPQLCFTLVIVFHSGYCILQSTLLFILPCAIHSLSTALLLILMAQLFIIDSDQLNFHLASKQKLQSSSCFHQKLDSFYTRIFIWILEALSSNYLYQGPFPLFKCNTSCFFCLNRCVFGVHLFPTIPLSMSHHSSHWIHSLDFLHIPESSKAISVISPFLIFQTLLIIYYDILIALPLLLLDSSFLNRLPI